jgi:hypothetical protein
MNPFIQVFQVREPFGDIYVLPPLDVLTDDGDCELPAVPQLTSVYPGSVGWFVVPGALGYKIERRLSGTSYVQIGTVSQPEDDVTTELVFNSTAVQHFGYYRVIASNSCGDSAPSAPMDLHNQAQVGSGDSSCTLWPVDVSSSVPVESSAPPDESSAPRVYDDDTLYLIAGGTEELWPGPVTEGHSEGIWLEARCYNSPTFDTFTCSPGLLTLIDFSGNTVLGGLSAENNFLTSLDLTGNTALTVVGLDGNDLTSLDVSGLTILSSLSVTDNVGLTDITMTGVEHISTFAGGGCAFTEAAVDKILAAAVAGALISGTITLNGGTSAPPSAAGLASIADLTNGVTKFWTIYVNS